MGVIAEGIPRDCQGLFTPVSLGYPLSVFNKNSNLKRPGGIASTRSGILLKHTLVAWWVDPLPHHCWTPRRPHCSHTTPPALCSHMCRRREHGRKVVVSGTAALLSATSPHGRNTVFEGLWWWFGTLVRVVMSVLEISRHV